MPYALRTTPRAYADIDAAFRWLSQTSLTAAKRWYAGLLTAFKSLETNPERCPFADEAHELGLDLRQLLYGRRQRIYRILFTIDGNMVMIHRVRHAAQDRLGPHDL